MAQASRLVVKAPLVPPGALAFLGRRIAEIIGAGLIAVSAYLFLALISYSSTDPSLNRATDVAVRNLGGRPGAYAADLLLQTVGLGAALIVLMAGAWGWRLVRSHRLPLWWLRICLLPLSVILAAVGFAIIDPAMGLPRPFETGLGGAVGRMFLAWTTRTGADLQLGLGAETFAAAAAAIAAIGMVFALAVTWDEWRAIGRGLARTGNAALGAVLWIARWRPNRNPAQRRAAEKEIVVRRARVEPHLDDDEAPVARAPLRAVDDDDDDADPIAPPPPPRPAQDPKRVTPADLVESRPAIAAPKPTRKPDKQGSLPLPAADDYQVPPLDLLNLPDNSQGRAARPIDEAALMQNAQMLTTVLGDFGVEGQVVKVRPGPVVTLYEFEPAPGTKTSRIIGLSNDIARSMSALSVRSAVIPGKNVIGIELPNNIREVVYLRELLTGEAENRTAGGLTLALGKDIGGTPVVVDLARMPHLLIAGTTGSGKSVAINTMILSLLYRLTPAECRFIMIDPKMLELSVYDGIPHLLSPVVTDPKKAVVALKWVVREMENRYRAMSKLGVRNIAGYNARLIEAKRKGETISQRVQTGMDEDGKPIFEDKPLDLKPLPFIVVVVDEMADLMLVAGKEIEWAVQRLAQMARAAGIHILMATQRPSVDVITGTIKANFPTRISFQVTSKIDSRTILGEQGAEQLLGQGDMLYMAGGGRIIRVHGPFVSDREVESVVKFLKDQGTPDYLEDVTEEDDDGSAPLGLGGAPRNGSMDGEGGGSDQLYDQAVALVTRERKCSTSFIQRHLQIGYNRAARIVERMEAEGVVGQANHVGKREVIAPKGAYQED
jgi:DNA segregation ATPase FtsK/SpoIIIE, S-DNA-T family